MASGQPDRAILIGPAKRAGNVVRGAGATGAGGTFGNPSDAGATARVRPGSDGGRSRPRRLPPFDHAAVRGLGLVPPPADASARRPYQPTILGRMAAMPPRTTTSAMPSISVASPLRMTTLAPAALAIGTTWAIG